MINKYFKKIINKKNIDVIIKMSCCSSSSTPSTTTPNSLNVNIKPFDVDSFKYSNNVKFNSIDSHCHLTITPLIENIQDIINRAKDRGVINCIVCGICPNDDWNKLKYIYINNIDFIIPQFGLHPYWIHEYFKLNNIINDNNIQSNWEIELELILQNIPSAGVGECGLDKNIKRNTAMELQIDIVHKHFIIAEKYNRAITLHCVGAYGHLLDIIKKMYKVHSIVLHSCNTMNFEMLQEFIKFPNIYYSINGKYIYKENDVKLIKSIPIDKLLIETDSPDQLPYQFKDQMNHNEPFLVEASIILIAKILDLNPIELASLTTNNSLNAFKYT